MNFITLEATAAPLADPLGLFKGEVRDGVCSHQRYQCKENSLASYSWWTSSHWRLRLPPWPTPFLHSSTLCSRTHRCATRVHISALIKLDRVEGIVRLHRPCSLNINAVRVFKGMKIKSLSYSFCISWIRSWFSLVRLLLVKNYEF
jgi:hypothetical protein